MLLKIIPCSLKEANEFIKIFHRHHGPVVGHKFSIAAVDETGKVRGVAVAGRPVARLLDDGFTLEVTRLCTDGVRNGCSFLYGAIRRIAKDMGYKKVITYTLITEPGSSLKAAGWKCVGKTKGDTWNRPKSKRIRNDKHPTVPKLRWEAIL